MRNMWPRWNAPRILAIVLLLVAAAGAAPLSTTASPPVLADVPLFLNSGQGTAVIDGYIDPVEWSTADSLSFTMSSSITTTYSSTLYVMQDATNLYLGFAIGDDEFTTAYTSGLYGDTLQLDFDDNDSGALFEVGENRVNLYAAVPWLADNYFVSVTGSSAYDIDAGGTTDGVGLSARHGANNHYELSFPLCSGDAHDFCLHPNDIVGLRIKYYDMYLVLEEPQYQARAYPSIDVTPLLRIQIADFVHTVLLPLILK